MKSTVKPYFESINKLPTKKVLIYIHSNHFIMNDKSLNVVGNRILDSVNFCIIPRILNRCHRSHWVLFKTYMCNANCIYLREHAINTMNQSLQYSRSEKSTRLCFRDYDKLSHSVWHLFFMWSCPLISVMSNKGNNALQMH